MVFYEFMQAVKIYQQLHYSAQGSWLLGAVNGGRDLPDKQKSVLVHPLGMLNIGFSLPNNKLSVYLSQSPSI